MADGGVAADPFGQLEPVGGPAALEELLDAAVDEPQPGLEPEDGLADDGEAEVAGLDHAGVDRADRDLVDARALDGPERVRTVDVAERRAGAGVGDASGTSPAASGSAAPAGGAAGGRSGAMPNRSRISRSNRPAGNDEAGQAGDAGRRVEGRTCSHAVRPGGHRRTARST